MKDFDNGCKNCVKCGQIGQNNCCPTGFEKLPKVQKIAQSGQTGNKLGLQLGHGGRIR